VIATGGGAPTKSENWGHMQGGISVWLNGPPTLLAHRVVGDGTENRPLLAQVGQYMVGEGGCRLWLPVPFPAAA
jgi:shikimate kinase